MDLELEMEKGKHPEHLLPPTNTPSTHSHSTSYHPLSLPRFITKLQTLPYFPYLCYPITLPSKLLTNILHTTTNIQLITHMFESVKHPFLYCNHFWSPQNHSSTSPVLMKTGDFIIHVFLPLPLKSFNMH